MHDKGASLQMDHELIMYRPIAPIKGAFLYQDGLTAVYDRGEGRGAVLKNEMRACDEVGNHLCTNIPHTRFTSLGGFGGEKMPVLLADIPDREPDCPEEAYAGQVQGVLYRLTGDTKLVQVDQGVAQGLGQKRVFVQGPCSFQRADMQARADTARPLVYQAACARDAGQTCSHLAAMAKLVAAQNGRRRGPPLRAAVRRLWLHRRIPRGAYDAGRQDHRAEK